MPIIERRYAEALVNIAEQSASIDSYQDEFRNIVEIFDTHPDFKVFLLNPEFKSDIKKEVIRNIFSNSVRIELVNFLMLLIDKGRMKLLPGIFDEFSKLADKKKNLLNMTIISASSLEESQINEIKEKYRKLYNAYYVKADIEIDVGLIGGVKVRIGDKVTDGTIKGRLESLKHLLVK